MITWIIVSIIAITTIIIKVFMGKEKSTPKKNIVEKEEPHSDDKPDKPADSHAHGSHDGDHKNTTATSAWSDVIMVFSIIIFLTVLIFGIILGIRYIKKTKPKSETEYYWKVEKTITIYFTGEYGEIYSGVSTGTNTSSQNATEPYCVENKIENFCFQKNEDMFEVLGNSTNNNNRLRFKSQNGKPGSIDIIFWVWTVKN